MKAENNSTDPDAPVITYRTEWACVERGFEDEATWFPARGTAEFDVTINNNAGLNCYLGSRILGEWPIVEVTK